MIKRMFLVFSIIMITILFAPGVYAESTNSLLDKAQTAYKKGNYQEALHNYTRAQVDKPDSAKLKYNIGNAFYRLKDLQKSLETYSSALKNKTDDKLKSKLYYNMGNTAYKKGDKDKALEYYLSSITYDPDDLMTRQNYEFVLKKKQSESCKSCNNKNKQQNKDKNKDKNKNQDKNKDKNKDKNENKNKNQDQKQDKNQEKNQKQPQNNNNAMNQQLQHQKLNQKQAELILSNLEEAKVAPEKKSLQGSYYSDKDW